MQRMTSSTFFSSTSRELHLVAQTISNLLLIRTLQEPFQARILPDGQKAMSEIARRHPGTPGRTVFRCVRARCSNRPRHSPVLNGWCREEAFWPEPFLPHIKRLVFREPYRVR